MTDENTSGATPAAAPVTTPAQAATNTSPDAQAADGNSEPISLDEARKLRSEANALRKREKEVLAQLKAFQDADQAAKDANLSEIERTKKQAADLQSKYESDTSALTERIVRYEVERQAAKLGIIDPDAAAQLIDWDALEYDEDGTPKNAEALLTALLKAKPYLAGKAPSSSGGATNPSRVSSAASNGQLSWEVVTKMTPDQYNARRTEIMEWMKTAPMRRW